MYDILIRATSAANVSFCQIDEQGNFTWLDTTGYIEAGVIIAEGVSITLDKEAMARYNAAIGDGDPKAHHIIVGEGNFNDNRVVLFPSRKHGLALCQAKEDVRQPATALDAFV